MAWLEELKREHGTKFDRILTIHEEYILLSGFLRSYFHIDGIGLSDSVLFRDKLEQKKVYSRNGVATSAFASMQDVAELIKPSDLGTEYIRKPRLGRGCIDIHRGTGAEFLDEPANSRDSRYLIEEFVEGSQYHCDALISHDNELIYLVCSEYLFPSLNYGTDEAGSVIICDESLLCELRDFARQIINALPCRSGLGLHFDVYRRSSGELVAGEAACRPAGYRIRGMIAAAIGVDTIGSMLRTQADLPIRKLAWLRPRPCGWGGIRASNFLLRDEPDLGAPPPGVFEVRLRMRVGSTRGAIDNAGNHIITFLVRGATPEGVITAHRAGLSWARSKLEAVSAPIL